MKRLFVSLLRLGDLIMQKPLIESVGQDGEIHILMNDEFKQVQGLYPEWTFHFFPRQELQKLVNRPETSLLAPFEGLRTFIADLNGHQFEEVVNLTHNKVSAYVMDQIVSPWKRGLEFQVSKFKPFENSWQSFFNATFSENKRSEVHYLAALAKSLGYEVPRLRTVEDRRHSNLVYLQVLTSDSKKNWSLRNWQALAIRLAKMKPDWKIKILCADFEVEKIKNYFTKDQIEVTSLLKAREKLQQARLLISGDTSIAHLAAEVGAPSIILSLGSSDYTKTIPWRHGNWILTSEVACSPCPHGQGCTQAQHICGEALRVATVLSVVSGIDRDQYAYSLAKPESIYRSEYDLQFGMKPVNYSILGGQDVSGHANVL